jgi:hypothetical protein
MDTLRNGTKNRDRVRLNKSKTKNEHNKQGARESGNGQEADGMKGNPYRRRTWTRRRRMRTQSLALALPLRLLGRGSGGGVLGHGGVDVVGRGGGVLDSGGGALLSCIFFHERGRGGGVVDSGGGALLNHVFFHEWGRGGGALVSRLVFLHERRSGGGRWGLPPCDRAAAVLRSKQLVVVGLDAVSVGHHPAAPASRRLADDPTRARASVHSNAAATHRRRRPLRP